MHGAPASLRSPRASLPPREGPGGANVGFVPFRDRRPAQAEGEVSMQAGTRSSWVWIGYTLAVGLVLGLTVAVCTVRAAPSVSASASGITAGLLAATFVAILWYSWETHQLLDLQRESTEITRHPWLSATLLKMAEIEPPSRLPPISPTLQVPSYGDVRFRLPINNEGLTPAYIKRITVRGEPDDPSTGYGFLARERGEVRNQVIVPHDVLDLYLGRVVFTQSRSDYVVDIFVDIRYETTDGGSAMLKVGFRYSKGGWISLPTTYDITLGTGAQFPRRSSADMKGTSQAES